MYPQDYYESHGQNVYGNYGNPHRRSPLASPQQAGHRPGAAYKSEESGIETLSSVSHTNEENHYGQIDDYQVALYHEQKQQQYAEQASHRVYGQHHEVNPMTGSTSMY